MNINTCYGSDVYLITWHVWSLKTCYTCSYPPLPHPQINPPHYIPLVEVVPAPWTEEGVVSRTVALLRGLGQAPVRLKKEVNGFIVNRLQYALIMEAWRLVEVLL